MSKQEQTHERAAVKVTRNNLAGNVSLSAFKLAAGITAHSAAMVSDAIHSLSDVLADIIVMVGMKLSARTSDKEHPYGHERLECVAALLLSFILFVVGVLIGWDGIRKISGGQYETLEMPGLLALIAAAVSIVVKEAMYWYTRAAAKRFGSVALKASAWHHRSDALSSVGSFAGILGARLGFPVLDAVACVVICIFILKAALDIFREAIEKMTDTACEDTLVEEMRGVVLAQAAVAGIDRIYTRQFGNRIYVEVEISGDGNATLYESHEMAQQVHDAVEERFPKVKHCMVHVNPAGAMDN